MASTLTIYKGTTFNPLLTYTVDNVAINLTGKEVIFHVRYGNRSSDFLAVSSDSVTTLQSTITFTNPTAGEFELLITDEETSTFRFTDGTWFLTLEDGGNSTLIGKGKLVVKNL